MGIEIRNQKSGIRSCFVLFSFLPRHIVVFFIRVYQKLFSPDHSFWAKHYFPHGYCKFHPTCSNYGVEVVTKRGVIVGGWKTLRRVLRCNPWNSGGVDLP